MALLAKSSTKSTCRKTSTALIARIDSDDGLGVEVDSDIFGVGANLAQDLAAAHEFTASDLAANQAGKLSPAQKRRLWCAALEPLRQSTLTLAYWLIFLATVKLFLVIVRPTDPLQLLKRCPSLIGYGLKALVVLIALKAAVSFGRGLFRSIGQLLSLRRDLSEGRVEVLEGRVSTSSTPEETHGADALHSETEDRYAYAIGDDYLPVSALAYRVLQPYSGSSCRVFVTPRSRWLLSIEPTKIRRSDRLVR